MGSFVAVILSLVLIALGVLHLHWAGGGLWPGRDPRRRTPRLPGPLAARRPIRTSAPLRAARRPNPRP